VENKNSISNMNIILYIREKPKNWREKNILKQLIIEGLISI